MAGGGSEGGSGIWRGDTTTPRPGYWSQRTLQEDKKRCLTDLPHTDHTVANTLEFLHEDKKHHSNKAIVERKKLHQPMRNEEFRRRPSTPTHPFAAASVGEQKKFWSHADLVDAKRKMKTSLVDRTSPTKGEFGKQEPMSAREPSSARERKRENRDDTKEPFSARSPGNGSGSFARRSMSEAESSRLSVRSMDRGPSGAHSPTVAEIIHHQGHRAEEHPHNETAQSWWETVREQRDNDKPHRSFEKFAVKKKHHMTEIHDTTTTKTPRSHYTGSFQQTAPVPGSNDSTPNVTLYSRDPKGMAVQGDYPHVATNEAWGPPAEEHHPPSRYHSCDLLALDKRRHATPIDGGKRAEQHRMADAHPFGMYTASPGLQTAKSDRALYRSNFTMQQHKKKHLVGTTPAASGFPKNGRGPGCPTPSIPVANGGSGFSSHRELQYCKRFNTVSLAPTQQIHKIDNSERPWPKPGDKQKHDSGAGGSPSTSSTPACPATPWADEPLTAQTRAHHISAITKYSAKSGVRNSLDSSASESALLHCSHQELAQRKGLCQTTIRHAPGDTPRDRTRDGKARSISRDARGNGSCSDLALRRNSSHGDLLDSHRQLEFSKAIHRFGHDDPRRTRPKPGESSAPPNPRSGQWTPAHA